MSDATSAGPTPQFSTAEYAGVSSTDHCQYCHQPIADHYFRVNDSMACSGCVDHFREEMTKDSHSAFGRAICFGIGAAILGLAMYATFAIMTGWVIGYASLAVGWLVGKAMIKGSGGIGGKRYQVVAAILTYAAVSMSAIPIAMHFVGERGHQAQQNHQVEQQSMTPQTSSSASAAGQPTTSAQASTPQAGQRPSLAKALGIVALIGLGSPFLELWESGPSISWVIGVVILVVGIRIAWRLTAGQSWTILGPFSNAPQPAP